MQYILTLWATLAVLGTAVSAGDKYARLWSGDFDACNRTEWSVEEEQMASTPRNMEVSHFWEEPCIAEQKDRKAVWVPSLGKDYCLVGSPDAHCPEKGGFMSGDTVTVDIPKDDWPKCVRWERSDLQSFEFYNVNCEKFKSTRDRALSR